MSREIKFRAWNTYSLRDGIEKRLLRMIDFQLGDTDEDLIVSSMSYIDDKTVIRRYTGLEDKNGKEIYEGDVVMPHSKDAPYAKARAVEFSPDRGWGLPKKEQHTEPTNGCVWWAQFEYEVIGNIYENPELLEKKP